MTLYLLQRLNYYRVDPVVNFGQRLALSCSPVGERSKIYYRVDTELFSSDNTFHENASQKAKGAGARY